MDDGDTDRVTQAYLDHARELTGWARRLLGEPQLAEDLVTEAFARLLTHQETVREPRPYLYATVAHLVHDHWRSRGRERAAYQRFQDDHGEPVDPGADRVDLLWVRAAVALLPARLREVVVLHYGADLSVAEVAHQVGRSPGAVKRDLHDARTLLADRLGDRRGGEP